ncbi:MAG: retropepsin-like aspartic protease [bacterium]|nr:retropepsin-like aspartic protease [bacterium]
MPSIFLQIQNMRVNGPVVPVKIDLPAKAREILAQSSQFVPPPIRVFGLVDTGATSTCISSKVCQQLALQPDGATKMLTAGHPVYVPVYTVGLSIEFAPGRFVTIENLPVAAPPLAGQANVDCLIGRDVLEHAVLVYVGHASSISLSL